jgi:hypothetical protein
VTPMAGRGADAHCDTKAASAKHSDPTAKSRPIHHETRSGRHQTPSTSDDIYTAAVLPSAAGAAGAAVGSVAGDAGSGAGTSRADVT